MFAHLLLTMAVCVAQPADAGKDFALKSGGAAPAQEAPEAIVISVPGPPPTPAPPPPPAPATPTPPDRWILMKSLQGTWRGALLDSERMQVTGWADVSFTASSATHSNLPMGFNDRANDFLLQQNWFRFERAVVTAGTTEPTFGFRCDTILPGSDYFFTLARGIFNDQLTADHGRPQRRKSGPCARW